MRRVPDQFQNRTLPSTALLAVLLLSTGAGLAGCAEPRTGRLAAKYQ